MYFFRALLRLLGLTLVRPPLLCDRRYYMFTLSDIDKQEIKARMWKVKDPPGLLFPLPLPLTPSHTPGPLPFHLPSPPHIAPSHHPPLTPLPYPSPSTLSHTPFPSTKPLSHLP